MLSVGHAGFVYAPLTKSMVCGVVLLTVFGSIIGSQSRLTLHYEAVTRSYQVWRLISHHFVFSTPGELLFGLVLMYYYRQFERHNGTSKFCFNFLVIAFVYTWILLYISSSINIAFASGPYAFIMMVVMQFIFETPRIFHFRIFHIAHLSDKTLPYLVIVQFLMSNSPASLLSASVAAAVVLAFRLVSVMVGPHFDFPQPMISFASSYILPWLSTTPRTSASTVSLARRHRAAARYARVTAAVNEILESPESAVADEHEDRRPVVSSDHVNMLLAMGFSRNDSISALQQTGDNVQAATELLLRNTN